MNRHRIGNVFLVLLIGTGYFFFVRCTGAGIPCLFRYFFQVQCPGCGVTHMLLALSEGRLEEAFASNQAVFCTAPFLLWLAVRSLWAYVTDRTVRWHGAEKSGMVLELVVLLIFGVWRNLR